MAETCKSCHDPLTLTLDPEESGDEGETVPDDLLLPCGCHFHWQCLLDESTTITSTLNCPSCTNYLPSTPSGPSGSSSSSSTTPQTPHHQILTRYHNEGGLQPNLDIYPALLEESFLTTNPSARPARALHTLAAEGDVPGMISLLADLDTSPHGHGGGEEDDEEEDNMTAAQLLAWRDPLNGLRTALHVALEAQQEEVVWLLLWLGSGVERDAYPEAVVQAAEGAGLPRPGPAVPAAEDVRFVRDGAGRAAEDVCLELGAPWDRLVEGGLFLSYTT
jgi:hypothetical protein